MIQYRTFRNSDPPGLVKIWNQAFKGRSAVQLVSSSALEHFVFAKSYFDPAGVTIAYDDGTPVGFAHAGFGSDSAGTGLDYSTGVVCLIAVVPTHRRRGIGAQLLSRSESYLRGRGAQTLFAGPMKPHNPFYFGLYGGCQSAGFLTSDSTVAPFLARFGYESCDSALILQRSLGKPMKVSDPRFAGLRRRFEIYLAPRTGTVSWWQECVLGPVEQIEFRLKEKSTAQTVARATVWEMDGFGYQRNDSTVGLADVEVIPELRRQGMAKFLLTNLMLNLQDQFFTLTEAHVSEENEAVVELFRKLEFEQVDIGRTYRKKADQ